MTSAAVARAPSAERSGPAVLVERVTKQYGAGAGAVLAVDGITLEVDHGEFLCVVGASGCGKSTLLSLIAGLDAPTRGTVSSAGRSTALMFQEPALMPWLTVERNVDLPLKLQGVARPERREEVERLLHIVQLYDFRTKRPHELSGGMRQRVALARALAQRSEVVLMDEPFSALDAITRDLLHEDLIRVWKETQRTIVFVTHNVREAVTLGDRIVMLSSRPGRVIHEFPIDLDRPRRMEDPGVAHLAATVTQLLRREISRHGNHR